MKRKVFACVLLLVAVISAAYAAEGKKALMVIASQDFRDEELLTPKEILENKRGQGDDRLFFPRHRYGDARREGQAGYPHRGRERE